MIRHSQSAAVNLVLFDLDGTLADTFKDLFWALNRALKEHGFGPAHEATIRTRVSLGGRAMSQAALPPDCADVDDVHQRFLAIYEQHLATRTTLFGGMAQVLSALDDAGIGYGVVTNKQSRFSEPLIEQLQLRSRLCCLISADTASRAKPHPEPLLLAAKHCGVGVRHCVYVGDAVNDVIAAHAARMRALVAAWGYIGADEDPRSWQADALLEHPTQLRDWLQQHTGGQVRQALPGSSDPR